MFQDGFYAAEADMRARNQRPDGPIEPARQGFVGRLVSKLLGRDKRVVLPPKQDESPK